MQYIANYEVIYRSKRIYTVDDSKFPIYSTTDGEIWIVDPVGVLGVGVKILTKKSNQLPFGFMVVSPI